ncbi:hypothetical protein CCMA1212_004067 [Trichoderma ghanense]|uniref:Uncharacterized protein n=1 Tax=Trichoderma ghanense TaxID=65468 RepID=A0ABY2H7Y2_9HYPO
MGLASPCARYRASTHVHTHLLAHTIGHDSFTSQGNPGCVERQAEIRANASRPYPAEKPQEFGDCMLTHMHTITGTVVVRMESIC